MINGKENLFSYLIIEFPGFKKQWESEDNYNINEDGSYTTAGLCAEFSQFYIDAFDLIDKQHKEKLFSEIEFVLTKPRVGDDLLELTSSIKSCFLENISRTEAGEASKTYMGNATRQFFDRWHVYP